MGNVTKPKEAPDSSGEDLCPDEVMAALDALSCADKLKLDRIEDVRRRGARFEKGELLREAICKTLLGKRKCPRSVPFVAFLAQTMRSIASHDRVRANREPSFDVTTESGGAARTVMATLDRAATETHDQDARSADTVDEILALFDGDEAAQLVIMGWADGCRGPALREATGLDQAGVDYAAKRIKKKMRTRYPNGWTG